MLKTLLITAAVGALSIGAASVASAATTANLGGNYQQAATSDTMLQNVHWERRGRHRVWVPDHRPRRPYRR